MVLRQARRLRALIGQDFLRTATSISPPPLTRRIDRTIVTSAHFANMGASFDSAVDRPEHIETSLNGLDRYNPETTGVFQDYVASQCENQTYDCYANLALLKLYVQHNRIFATRYFFHRAEARTT